jgi:signal transduction histidine kinase
VATSDPNADELRELRQKLVGARAEQDQLRASRARIVQAADAERLRLERDLHDGAQQRLVSLLLTLRLIERSVADREDLAARIASAGAELALALEELRELAQRLHPAVLATHGLGPALGSLASRASVPVELSVEPATRPGAAVETAVYRVVAEAIANAQRRAEATSVQVRVRTADRMLDVEIVDDGLGGVDTSPGSALVGVGDRVAALGGTFEAVSLPAGGARIAARIPIG